MSDEKPGQALPPETDTARLQRDDPMWEVIANLGRLQTQQGQLLTVQQRKQLATHLMNLVQCGALSPVERAEMGRILSEIGDTRPGVDVIVRDGVALPDIAWSDPIPPDEYPIGGDEDVVNSLSAEMYKLEYSYQVSKYPVTYAQFQVFLDAADGYSSKDHDWFKDMAAGDDDKQVYEQWFKYNSHPRENVNWYEALAFCRWLSWRLGGRFYELDEIALWPVRLPTDYEWEIAARGPEGRIYPYAGEFDAAKGNTEETGIGQTSAVGIFPDGVSWCGALDMSGNVWEWCINPDAEPDGGLKPEHLRSSALRVLRGGWWDFGHSAARAASRFDDDPDSRGSEPDIGFRLCRLPHLMKS